MEASAPQFCKNKGSKMGGTMIRGRKGEGRKQASICPMTFLQRRTFKIAKKKVGKNIN